MTPLLGFTPLCQCVSLTGVWALPHCDTFTGVWGAGCAAQRELGQSQPHLCPPQSISLLYLFVLFSVPSLTNAAFAPVYHSQISSKVPPLQASRSFNTGAANQYKVGIFQTETLRNTSPVFCHLKSLTGFECSNSLIFSKAHLTVFGHLQCRTVSVGLYRLQSLLSVASLCCLHTHQTHQFHLGEGCFRVIWATPKQIESVCLRCLKSEKKET